MNRVFVLDKNKEPLIPCHPARARQMLKAGKARVFRRHPFIIIMVDRIGGEVQDTQLKIDPGSRTTGLALVADFKRGKRVIWAANLHHRGLQIKSDLDKRSAIRRSRRHRKTRYRQPRFDNRRRAEGWLPPSLMSRVYNIKTWCSRLYRFAPYNSLSLERVKFDTQKMQNPEISGVEYQQGELWGYEVRKYLLEKWGRKCAYCGVVHVPLEVEHIVPKSRNGSDRVSNLTIACCACNKAKDNQTAEEFGYPDLHKQAQKPLRDVSAVNATRNAVFDMLCASGLSVETGTGARTKYNRIKQEYPKAHWIDATCVGESGEQVFIHPRQSALDIRAVGHGARQMCRMNRYGFPRTSPKPRTKGVQGFTTGDIVKAIVPDGKYKGTFVGRVAVRTSRPPTGRSRPVTNICKSCIVPMATPTKRVSSKHISITGLTQRRKAFPPRSLLRGFHAKIYENFQLLKSVSYIPMTAKYHKGIRVCH